jgi:D-alanyl-D-alanine dipeptidase
MVSVGCKNGGAHSTGQDTKSENGAHLQIEQLEQKLIDAGLVNIQTIEPGIRVELKYSTLDNFMHKDMYGSLENAYLQPDVAQKLSKAYKLLAVTHPELTLLVYDAVRPLHIQQMMWDSLDIPLEQKNQFLSNPKNGSVHNYGAAVDLTLCTLDGKALDMGCAYDFIGELARPDAEQKFLTEGKLTLEQVNNRKLLRKTMLDAGFRMIDNEWWHFNSCSRDEAKRLYKVIE